MLRSGVAPTAFASLLERYGGVEVARAGAWQEDDLAVGGLSHSLHSFEVADLHSRSRTENVGGLPHQFGRFNLDISQYAIEDFGENGSYLPPPLRQ